MYGIQDIQSAISDLPPADLVRLKDWFNEFVANQWDKQIEVDIKAGKLDEMADKALADHKKGMSTEL